MRGFAALYVVAASIFLGSERRSFPALPKIGVSSAAPLMLAGLPDEAADEHTWLNRHGYMR